MKTYILDSINRFKRFSEKIDVATTLSNKTWVVFNDSGERELYIFQPDGSVIITSNGIGVRGQWQWIAANQSLIIHHNDTVIMLHPQYIDGTILALNLDGTKETAFLIEDKNRESFAPKSLVQLEMYFENKEQKMLLEQRREEQRRADEQRRIREQQRVEEEQRLIQIQRQRESDRIAELQRQKLREENNIKFEASILRNKLVKNYDATVTFISIAIGVALCFLFWYLFLFKWDWRSVFALLLPLIIGVATPHLVLIPLLKYFINELSDNEQRINQWKRDNPNDPRNKYL